MSELRCHVCGRTFQNSETGAASVRCPYCQMTVPVTSTSAASQPGHAGGGGDEWHVCAVDGRRFGPITKADLDRWVAENRLTPQCQVYQQGWPNWKFAPEVYPQLQAHSGAIGGTAAAQVTNPYAAPAFTGFQTSAATYKTPHRGAMILTFGILGWAICVIFAPFAWAMGASDLKAMKRGAMDDSGQGLTMAGMILGMIQSILFLFVIVVYGIIIAIAIAADA